MRTALRYGFRVQFTRKRSQGNVTGLRAVYDYMGKNVTGFPDPGLSLVVPTPDDGSWWIADEINFIQARGLWEQVRLKVLRPETAAVLAAPAASPPQPPPGSLEELRLRLPPVFSAPAPQPERARVYLPPSPTVVSTRTIMRAKRAELEEAARKTRFTGQDPAPIPSPEAILAEYFRPAMTPRASSYDHRSVEDYGGSSFTGHGSGYGYRH